MVKIMRQTRVRMRLELGAPLLGHVAKQPFDVSVLS